jgi:hypothetical protein
VLPHGSDKLFGVLSPGDALLVSSNAISFDEAFEWSRWDETDILHVVSLRDESGSPVLVACILLPAVQNASRLAALQIMSLPVEGDVLTDSSTVQCAFAEALWDDLYRLEAPENPEGNEARSVVSSTRPHVDGVILFAVPR